MSTRSHGALLVSTALSCLLTLPVRAQLVAAASPRPIEQVLITGARAGVDAYSLPATVESVTAARLAETTTVLTAEDALKYMPSIVVRRRHIGDTQAPIATRTSGVGASARSLVYADGVLLSALIGNNNSFASPRWGMVAPEEIARVDVIYGPFSALYPGNAIGAVVEITTRMPQMFEASGRIAASRQSFRQYGTKGTYPAYELGAFLGDRAGRLAWALSLNHLDSESQPLAYVTALVPASPRAGGTPVSGAFAALNRTGAPIVVIGAGGFEHQLQDTLHLKLSYDLAPHVTASYSAGLFLHADDAAVETYLRDAAGLPVYAGSVNIAGASIAIPASAFSNNLYRRDDLHWMQSLALKSQGDGGWDWDATAVLYRFAKDRQRNPTVALPLPAGGGAGTIMALDGTGWATLDARAIWRPRGADGAQELSFGAHGDRATLNSRRFATSDWRHGPDDALAGAAAGRTETLALWLQDKWRFAPDLTATLGVRGESWRATDGFNYSASPALSVQQPERSATNLSPKASLQWQPDGFWRVTASYGGAYRFPTVSELYQTVTTGAVLSVPNPDLTPEHAHSAELALMHMTDSGMARLSLFHETIFNALLSQSAPLLPGSTTLFNYVQNVDEVRSRGMELSLQQNDVLVDGLELFGSVTYVDSEIRRDTAFPAAIGKQTPQVPRWRATVGATWRPNDALSLTLAARYSTRVYANIDNSDSVTHTYQGFDPYLVLDARALYRVDAHWSVAAGVDNLTNRKYFLFHPFPQRAFTAELNYAY
jgi:iron complex outermembrane receptor protein